MSYQKGDFRKGDWLQTASGVQYWPLDPRASEIRLEDIAHALSNQCRFGGHCRLFYSVAQHCVHAAENVAEEFKARALLHDGTETYVVDVPRPLKRNLIGYDAIETLNAVAMSERFGTDLVILPREVKEADERMLWTEKRDLCLPAPAPWTIAQGVSNIPYEMTIHPWSPEKARDAFLSAAAALGIK